MLRHFAVVAAGTGKTSNSDQAGWERGTDLGRKNIPSPKEKAEIRRDRKGKRWRAGKAQSRN